MFAVKFFGFETREEAESFISWYEGSGEQDSSNWREEYYPDSNWNAGSGLYVTVEE